MLYSFEEAVRTILPELIIITTASLYIAVGLIFIGVFLERRTRR